MFTGYAVLDQATYRKIVSKTDRSVKAVFLRALQLGQEAGSIAAAPLVAGDRHATAKALARRFVQQGKRRISRRDRFDDLLLHPVWGYVILLAVLYFFFEVVYGVGRLIEPPLLAFFNRIANGGLLRSLDTHLLGAILNGILQGVTAGVFDGLEML